MPQLSGRGVKGVITGPNSENVEATLTVALAGASSTPSPNLIAKSIWVAQSRLQGSDADHEDLFTCRVATGHPVTYKNGHNQLVCAALPVVVADEVVVGGIKGLGGDLTVGKA